jgi:hypothetical protein
MCPTSTVAMSTLTQATVTRRRRELVEVELELLAVLPIPSIMPLSWDFTAR